MAVPPEAGSGTTAPRPAAADIVDRDPAEVEVAIVDQEPGREHLSSDEEQRRLKLRSLAQDIQHRELYAKRIFVFVCFWVAALLGIVTLQGWKPGGFELTDGVLIALIGGTTANVLGLFVVVANYLFPKR